jgi:two-component system cell cycle sensor histidine kinase/response regulator CckA
VRSALLLVDARLLAVERQQKNESLRETEEKLLHAQKMEAIGRLAGGIAHDFNNLLTVVNGYVDMLLTRLSPGDPIRDDLTAVKSASDRAIDLTRQLLAFGRKQMLQPKPLDLNDAVSDMERMLRRLIGEDVELRIELARDLRKVTADPSQIGQVIVNLAVNARDAMPHGGVLTISTANVEVGAGTKKQPELAAGPYVKLAVRDTGEGMPPETLARIFEPFFTTKEIGKGSGLGLSTVHGIVSQSGGHIQVSSEPDHGTAFDIYLPSTGEADGGADTEPAESTRGASGEAGGATILLVEDDDLVRKLAQYVLEADGYRVLSTNGADDAIALCERYDGPIDLLLTDMILPKMGGRQLAGRVAVHRPDLPVLFMSGYAEDVVARHGVDDATSFIAKPFLPEALVDRVRELLGRRKAESPERGT